MSWNNDINFSIAMEKHADKIYHGLLPITNIKRFTRNDGKVHILDKKFHIDCVLTLQNGMILTLQEKFLRAKFAIYDCFTLEYFNNQLKNEKGEWHSLCSDLYFTGYGDIENGFNPAYLFKTIDVKLAIMSGELQGELKKTSTSNANFYAFPFRDFKEEYFVNSNYQTAFDIQ